MADILEMWDYIAEDSLTAADRWVDGLDENLARLATQPMMGRAREELAPGVRSFPYGRYVIFYSPLADGIDDRWIAAANATGWILGPTRQRPREGAYNDTEAGGM